MAPERGLLRSKKEVEIQHLIHEMFLLSKQISNKRHRTPDIVQMILKLAARVNALGYTLLWETEVVGASGRGYTPERWALLEEYTEPTLEAHRVSNEYHRMKSEIMRLTVAEAAEQLRELRRRRRT